MSTYMFKNYCSTLRWYLQYIDEAAALCTSANVINRITSHSVDRVIKRTYQSTSEGDRPWINDRSNKTSKVAGIICLPGGNFPVVIAYDASTIIGLMVFGSFGSVDPIAVRTVSSGCVQWC